eukprot:scaffold17647_cov83-Skeletonema_dohrnii-CCMP3373.AAC.6
MDLIALMHSVFSEAFLVGVDALVSKFIDLTALRLTIRLIDRARSQLSKTPPIAVTGRLGEA